jgi:hypothetical protein
VVPRALDICVLLINHIKKKNPILALLGSSSREKFDIGDFDL